MRPSSNPRHPATEFLLCCQQFAAQGDFRIEPLTADPSLAECLAGLVSGGPVTQAGQVVPFVSPGTDAMRSPAFRSYSCRRAIIGSMREARRAGTKHASAATPIRIRATPATIGM